MCWLCAIAYTLAPRFCSNTALQFEPPLARESQIAMVWSHDAEIAMLCPFSFEAATQRTGARCCPICINWFCCGVQHLTIWSQPTEITASPVSLKQHASTGLSCVCWPNFLD